MSVLNCKRCNVLFNESNKPKNRNYCRPCIYQKDKERQEKQYQGVYEKECVQCKKTKPICKYSNSDHTKCRECSVTIKVVNYTTDLVCTKCGIILTFENKRADRNQCKSCAKRYKKELVESKKLKELQTEN